MVHYTEVVMGGELGPPYSQRLTEEVRFSRLKMHENAFIDTKYAGLHLGWYTTEVVMGGFRSA
jgi:hypothetical protein